MNYNCGSLEANAPSGQSVLECETRVLVAGTQRVFVMMTSHKMTICTIERSVKAVNCNAFVAFRSERHYQHNAMEKGKFAKSARL